MKTSSEKTTSQILKRMRISKLSLSKLKYKAHSAFLGNKWRDIVLHFVHFLTIHCGSVEVLEESDYYSNTVYSDNGTDSYC